MDMEELLQAVNELLAAESPEEVQGVLVFHHELLEESNIRFLYDVAAEARAQGESVTARVLERVAAMLAQIAQSEVVTAKMFKRILAMLAQIAREVGEASSSEPEQIKIEPVSPESSVPWARLARQYLSSQKEEFLEQAIEAAQSSVEQEVVTLLRSLKQRDFEVIAANAPQLSWNFLAKGRHEEGITISLVGLDWQSSLVMRFKPFPLKQQAAVLELGIQSCQQAANLARALGDKDCQAFYKAGEGLGLFGWRRLSEAEAACREALAIRRELADKQPQVYGMDLAVTLDSLGVVLRDLRRWPEAEAAYREALVLYRKLAPEQPWISGAYASTLNNLGIMLHDLQQLPEAEAACREALEVLKVWRELVDEQPLVDEIYAATLNNLGNALRDLWRHSEAEAAYREALEARRRRADRQQRVYDPDVAMTLHNLGNLLHDLRRLPEAEAAYQEALEARRELAREQPQAYEYYVVRTLINLGALLRDLRRLPEAEAAYREALVLCRRLALEQPHVHEPEVAMTLQSLGAVLRDLERLPEAEAACREALAAYRMLAQEQPRVYESDVARTLNGLGVLLRDLKRLPEAEAAYREALELYRKLADEQPRIYEAYAATLNNLGNVLRILQRLPEAEAVYREGLMICRQHDLPTVGAKMLSSIGLLEMIGEHWEVAAETLREAMEQAERLRAEVQSLDRRRQIFREHLAIYENLLICLMKTGRSTEALEVAEQGKSRTLIDLLTLRDLRPRNAPPELAHEYERTLLRARALEERLQRGALPDAPLDLLPEERIAWQEQQVESMRRERVETNHRLDVLVRDIRRHDPDFLPHAKTLKADDIKKLGADAKATLLLFRVTAAGSFIFLVFPDGETDVVPVPEFTTNALSEMLVRFENGEAVDGWVVRYYAYLSAVSEKQQAQRQAKRTQKQEDKEIAEQATRLALQAQSDWRHALDSTLGQLYERLLAFAHQRLKKKQQSDVIPNRVVIVPNRGLAILPLHACWWEENGGRRYLLDEYVVSYAPSLSVFKRCVEREREGRARDTMLAIANPTRDLIFSDWECKEIERMFGPERCLVLWHEKATVSETLKWIEQRNWLHFSCHGQYRLDAPFESTLHLANGERLTLGEMLDKLNLRQSWLTVLSACETGLTDFREIADEHYGLPLGFLFAGVPTVWGTLWAVSDHSTALLMRAAYENLLPDSADKPEALRQAQIWLRGATAEELSKLIENKQIELADERMSWSNLLELAKKVFGNNPQECPFDHPYFWAGMQCVGV